MLTELIYACIAGILGSIGGALAKCFHSVDNPMHSIYAKFGLYTILNVCVNALMWYVYTQAMSKSAKSGKTASSDLVALKMAANAVTSLLIGVIFFDEKISSAKCISVLLIIFGVFLITSTSSAITSADTNVLISNADTATTNTKMKEKQPIGHIR